MKGNPQQTLLAQLADIHGLDAINWWPLAPGWWALILLVSVLLVGGLIWVLRRQAYRRSWRYQASATLTDMNNLLDEINAHEILHEFSVLMRRIAMRRFSRGECAGLEGDVWLDWLKRHDPCGFDWCARGGVLTDTAYAPPEEGATPETVRPLIRAAQAWVK